MSMKLLKAWVERQCDPVKLARADMKEAIKRMRWRKLSESDRLLLSYVDPSLVPERYRDN